MNFSESFEKNSEDEPMSVIATGQGVVLRDGILADADSYVRWMKFGEWIQFDAPWETDWQSMTDDEIRKTFSERFLHKLSTPRKRAIIATKKGKPLGWVNRYGEKKFSKAWLIGIDSCEDDYLNKGLGTEAFGLWVDYLFSKSDVHRIGFATYSFNPRMIRVGEKLGFVHEGTEREVVCWQGNWLDLLHFGMLRKEWDRQRSE
jgi:RimJ/RimL family protein N-acetyltransferase